MKRICVAVTNDLTHDRRMHRICRTLVHDGYEVELVGRKLKDSSSVGDLGFAYRRMMCWFGKGIVFYAEYNIRLFFSLLFMKFDIGVSCDLDTAPAVRLSCWLRRKKSVFDAHELFTEVPELQGRRMVKAIWNLIGRITVPGFAARYTVGPQLAEVLSEKYGCSFSVVRNVPVTYHTRIPDLSQREPVIIYQGALNAGRGLEQAIEAMGMIEGYSLHLAGEGDLSRELRKQVLEMQLGEKVHFLGKVSPENLSDIGSRAVIGLNLLDRKSTSYYYSLANKFFDYMHAGVPSINMDFPEYRHILSRHAVGITIDTLDPVRLSQILRGLLGDCEKLRSMIDSCLTARAEFCWEEESDQLLEVYRKLEFDIK